MRLVNGNQVIEIRRILSEADEYKAFQLPAVDLVQVKSSFIEIIGHQLGGT